jgi:hypothetical protein
LRIGKNRQYKGASLQRKSSPGANLALVARFSGNKRLNTDTPPIHRPTSGNSMQPQGWLLVASRMRDEYAKLLVPGQA